MGRWRVSKVPSGYLRIPGGYDMKICDVKEYEDMRM